MCMRRSLIERIILNFFFFFFISGSNSGSATNGVISFSTPNSFQQFFSPSFGQFGALYAAVPSASGANPQVLNLNRNGCEWKMYANAIVLWNGYFHLIFKLRVGSSIDGNIIHDSRDQCLLPKGFSNCVYLEII